MATFYGLYILVPQHFIPSVYLHIARELVVLAETTYNNTHFGSIAHFQPTLFLQHHDYLIKANTAGSNELETSVRRLSGF